VGVRVDMIVSMPVLGLAAGAATVVGMFAGAARPDLVRVCTSYLLRWAVGFATVLGLSVFVTRDLVLSVFTSDAPTIAVGRHYLSFMVFVYPMMGAGMMGSRLLLGLGYPNLSLLLTTVRLVVIAVPVAYISVYVLGGPLDHVWWAILSGAAAANILAVALVYHFIWQRDPTVRAVRAAAT
jgi:Na+-driven multidrug efflux pump